MARLAAPGAYVASAALHGALLLWLGRAALPEPARSVPVDVEIVEVPRPPPPEEPPPARRAPRRVAAAPAARAAPRRAPPPAPEAPPPPNAPAATDARAPVRIGLSMSSTTSAGPPAAVGNTLYGEAPRSGSDPAAAQPYGGERYAPPTEVTALPEPVATEIPKGEYPPEAQRAGVEGEVKLRLRIGADGRVERATVVRDPGHGFGPAAVESALRHFRFRPATRHGEPVATEIVFTVRYELP